MLSLLKLPKGNCVELQITGIPFPKPINSTSPLSTSKYLNISYLQYLSDYNVTVLLFFNVGSMIVPPSNISFFFPNSV